MQTFTFDAFDRRDTVSENVTPAGGALQTKDANYTYLGLSEAMTRRGPLTQSAEKTLLYDYDSSLAPLGMSRRAGPATAEEYRSFAKDVNGSIEGLTDSATGNYRARYAYDPYGNEEKSEGETPGSPATEESKDNVVRFRWGPLDDALDKGKDLAEGATDVGEDAVKKGAHFGKDAIKGAGDGFYEAGKALYDKGKERVTDPVGSVKRDLETYKNIAKDPKAAGKAIVKSVTDDYKDASWGERAGRAFSEVVGGPAKWAGRAAKASKATSAVGRSGRDDGAASRKPDRTGVGPHAKESIPARGPDRDFNKGERERGNEIGDRDGCHSCGTRDPGTKSGNWVLDHQPPTALLKDPKTPQRLFPQCLRCSREQGVQINKIKQEERKRARDRKRDDR